jgi:hypothetical protein
MSVDREPTGIVEGSHFFPNSMIKRQSSRSSEEERQTTKPEKQLEFKSAGNHTGKSGLDCLWSERLNGV